MSQKVITMLLTLFLFLTVRPFFGSWWPWSFRLWWLLVCFQVITTSSHHQLWTWTRWFHCLRWVVEAQCRRHHVDAFDQLWGSWGQLWLPCGTCQVLQWKHSDMSPNQFPLSHKAYEWSYIDSYGWAAGYLRHSEELWWLRATPYGCCHQMMSSWPRTAHATCVQSRMIGNQHEISWTYHE